MSDQGLLSAAVERFGSKQNVARALGVSPQTVSDWGKTRQRNGMHYVVTIPRAHRRMLSVLLNLPGDETMSAAALEPYQNPEWRQSQRHHKAVQQVRKLFFKTGGRGRDWEMVASVLDYAVPWADRDWRELYAALAAEEEHHEGQDDEDTHHPARVAGQ